MKISKMKKNSQSGLIHTLPLLLLVTTVGLISFLLISSTVPVGGLFGILNPKPSSEAAGPWAFEETFDGAPISPQPFKSPRWDIVIDSNDIDGVMDGQTVEGAIGSIDGKIELGHGPHCEPPLDPLNPNNPNNIHTIDVDFNPLGFQQNTRPFLNFICNNHMMSVSKAGYGISSFMPRQIFDWSGRTGTVEFETSLYPVEGGREWWDMYIAPPQEILLDHVKKDEGGTYEQFPKRAVKFKFGAQKMMVVLIDNYQDNYQFVHWQRFADAFPNDPALTDPKIRRFVRVQISNTTWKFQIQVDANAPANPPSGAYETVDGRKYWTFSQNWPQPLSFSQGMIRWGHHSYNATKDGNFGSPWSQFTFHWDNIRFDGPVIPAHTAFEPGPHFVDLRKNPDPNFISPAIKINVNVSASDIKNARLVGHIHSAMSYDTGDLTNSTGYEQFRVNGGGWQNVKYIKDIPIERTWTSFRNSLSNVVPGDNTIEFRYPLRPPTAPASNGYTVKDLEIQIDPVGSVVPPPPSPTPSSTPTPRPTSTPTACRLGDIDCDGDVDIFDFNSLVGNFGRTGSNIPGDLDNDSDVDIFDFNSLIENFGS